MAEKNLQDQPPLRYQAQDSTAFAPERRKPGRIAHINVHLKPLLRQSERLSLPAVLVEDGDPDPYSERKTGVSPPSKSSLGDGPGIVLGVLLGAALWSGIALLARMIF